MGKWRFERYQYRQIIIRLRSVVHHYIKKLKRYHQQ